MNTRAANINSTYDFTRLQLSMDEILFGEYGIHNKGLHKNFRLHKEVAAYIEEWERQAKGFDFSEDDGSLHINSYYLGWQTPDEFGEEKRFRTRFIPTSSVFGTGVEVETSVYNRIIRQTNYLNGIKHGLEFFYKNSDVRHIYSYEYGVIKSIKYEYFKCGSWIENERYSNYYTERYC